MDLLFHPRVKMFPSNYFKERGMSRYYSARHHSFLGFDSKVQDKQELLSLISDSKFIIIDAEADIHIYLQFVHRAGLHVRQKPNSRAFLTKRLHHCKIPARALEDAMESAHKMLVRLEQSPLWRRRSCKAKREAANLKALLGELSHQRTKLKRALLELSAAIGCVDIGMPGLQETILQFDVCSGPAIRDIRKGIETAKNSTENALKAQVAAAQQALDAQVAAAKHTKASAQNLLDQLEIAHKAYVSATNLLS